MFQKGTIYYFITFSFIKANCFIDWHVPTNSTFLSRLRFLQYKLISLYSHKNKLYHDKSNKRTGNNFKYDILVNNYKDTVLSDESQCILAQSGTNDYFVYFRKGLYIPQPAAEEEESEMIF